MKVIVYIDGYNFFIGLKHKSLAVKEWDDLAEIDLVKMATNYIDKYESNGELLKVKLFMAKPYRGRNYKGNSFTKYINKHFEKYPSQFQFIKGRFSADKRKCENCGVESEYYSEKLTDVNLSVEMVRDALDQDVDALFLISADSDFERPVKLAYRSCKKNVLLIIPLGVPSWGLTNFCDKQNRISAKSKKSNKLGIVRMNKHFSIFKRSVFQGR